MSDLHEARFYEKLPDGRVLCTLCPHDCRIPDGGRGACAVRYAKGGKLYTLVYDKVVTREIDPVEKKPLYHFYPGSTLIPLPRSAAICVAPFVRTGLSRSGPRNIWRNTPRSMATNTPRSLSALRSRNSNARYRASL